NRVGRHRGRRRRWVVDARALSQLQAEGALLHGHHHLGVGRPVGTGGYRAAGAVSHGAGEGGVVIGCPAEIDDREQDEHEDGGDHRHLDHRLGALTPMLHGCACTCMVVCASTWMLVIPTNCASGVTGAKLYRMRTWMVF